jgi:transmembrane sensor
MTDDAGRRIAEASVPWDDVRQRRVLARVEAAVQARAGARGRNRWLGAAASVVAAAGVVLALALPRAPVEETLAVAMPASAGPEVDVEAVALPSIPFAAWPELRLPDDSVAQLRHGARVEMDVQSDALVHLVQRSGQVRYEVAPDRTRAFVVDAAGVEVRVVGTIFTVTLADDARRVAVEVERGLVEVDNGERVAELGPGDRLSVDVEPVDEVVLLDEEAPEPVPTPTSRTSRPAPSVEALLADADAARARGELPRAASALSELVRHYSSDPQAYSAYFQLGKVERARGRHAAAAAAFAKCWKRAPQGALAEDARAEAAASWHAAGRDDRARTAAEGYLARHPAGTHHSRMRSLLAELP